MIIGFCGKKRSGKDTAAEAILAYPEYGFKRLAFADPMRKIVQELFNFREEQMTGSAAQREAGDPRYHRQDGQLLSARYAMQKLGTEFGRACCPDIWVRKTLDKAAWFHNVVITDVRFRNEIEAINEGGGRVIRIHRADSPLDGHASETEMDSFPDNMFAAVLNNDGTVAQFRQDVLTAVSALLDCAK
jgi:hypothetical protein